MLYCYVWNCNEHQFAGTNVVGSTSVANMVSKLKKPRRVMMLVKAGDAVDKFIDQLVPVLEKGDIIIDGGNSEYTDSIVSFSFVVGNLWWVNYCNIIFLFSVVAKV